MLYPNLSPDFAILGPNDSQGQASSSKEFYCSGEEDIMTQGGSFSNSRYTDQMHLADANCQRSSLR
jgi:hypothetical protein